MTEGVHTMSAGVKLAVSMAFLITCSIVLPILQGRLRFSRQIFIRLGILANYGVGFLVFSWTFGLPVWTALVFGSLASLTLPAFLRFVWAMADEASRRKGGSGSS